MPAQLLRDRSMSLSRTAFAHSSSWLRSAVSVRARMDAVSMTGPIGVGETGVYPLVDRWLARSTSACGSSECGSAYARIEPHCGARAGSPSRETICDTARFKAGSRMTRELTISTNEVLHESRGGTFDQCLYLSFESCGHGRDTSDGKSRFDAFPDSRCGRDDRGRKACYRLRAKKNGGRFQISSRKA